MNRRDMKPGNTDPNRYWRTGLSTAIIALIGAGAAAPDIMDQFILEREGSKQTAYLDGGSSTVKRIWTICKGLTRIDGKPVTEGMTLTKAECAKHDRKELQSTIDELQIIVKPQYWQELSQPAIAGIASFCTYNLGAPKCRGTTFLEQLNSGVAPNIYCAQITRWIRDQGRDCRVDSSCRGQVDRRLQEDELCLIQKDDPRIGSLK